VYESINQSINPYVLVEYTPLSNYQFNTSSLFEIAKRRSWARNTFRYQDGKLYANVSKTYALARDEENKRQ